MMNRLFLCLLIFTSATCTSQPPRYSTANAHSHNDYENKRPFYAAWEQQFGSIEADIFLHEGKLLVAHEPGELTAQRTLESLYLAPLEKCIRQNGGSVYKDKNRSLQLMIDIKTDAVATLDQLINLLNKHPILIKTSSLTITISGNRPSQFTSYPSWISFDGDLNKEYSEENFKRIPMLSDNYANYPDKNALLKMIARAHKLGKKIRFWNAPDSPEEWKLLMSMGVDYINTDKIEQLAAYLK